MSSTKNPPPAIGLKALFAKHIREIERVIAESGDHTHPSERTNFKRLLQLALWAQKVRKEPCDSIASVNEFIDDLSENLLCDNLSEIWFKVQDIKSQVRSSSNSETPTYLDFVTNSSGFEAFLELCFVHFLALMLCPVSLGSSGVRFRIYNKTNVVSLINQLAGSEQDGPLHELGMTWKSYAELEFWHLYDELADIPQKSDELYKSLTASKLIIFKGDRYYRKLAGEKKWHPLTPFRNVIQGFEPAPLAAIRAIESDIFAGIEDINIFARINNNELPRDWTTSGVYGLIQYYDPSK